MEREELISFFEFCLSQSPCSSGLRLQSEPELARLLNEGRQKVRRALNDLVERGYLTRRHGSGTFVRKVYPASAELNPETFLCKVQILPENIFHPETRDTTSHPDFQAQQLRIGLPGNSARFTKTNYSIYEAARRRIEDLGFIPVTYTRFTPENWTEPALREFRRELQEIRCDGFLAEVRWSRLFRNALQDVFGSNYLPISYFYPGSIDITAEPLVNLDIHEAIRRGVRILAEQGYQRIAMLAMPGRKEDKIAPLHVYLQSLIDNCLTAYQAPLILPLTHLDKHFEDLVFQSLDLLFSRNAPDALLVGNDHFLPVVQRYLNRNNLQPGREIGVITLANKNSPFEDGVNWSRLEFNPAAIGALAVDNLADAIEQPNEPICSMSQRAAWIPGESIRHSINEQAETKQGDSDHENK
jgi:DNA-binding LacI/PurR family transcriptional regulator